MSEYKLLSKLTTMAASLEEVAELFALTKEQMEDPACGKWLVDSIKQLQTSYMLRAQTKRMVDFPKAQGAGLPPIEGGESSVS